MKTNKQIIITAYLNIKAEVIAEFIEETKVLIAESRAEEGNISYNLYQDPFNSSQLIVVEEWKDREAVDYHFNTPHFKNFGMIAEKYITEPIKIKIYEAELQK